MLSRYSIRSDNYRNDHFTSRVNLLTQNVVKHPLLKRFVENIFVDVISTKPTTSSQVFHQR